jgi:hypothetical protein
MDDRQHPVTRAIRERIEAHEGSPAGQWYVDENCIDCAAGEFWAVVDEAVRASLAGPEPRTGEWAQDASGEPALRAGSDITVTSLTD